MSSDSEYSSDSSDSSGDHVPNCESYFRGIKSLPSLNCRNIQRNSLGNYFFVLALEDLEREAKSNIQNLERILMDIQQLRLNHFQQCKDCRMLHNYR
uniref:Uncharacterized protein n=1 Tax=Phlebotomus kandelakii TaxID=1109342 RepID=A0A6B2EJE4_9DIPT